MTLPLRFCSLTSRYCGITFALDTMEFYFSPNSVVTLGVLTVIVKHRRRCLIEVLYRSTAIILLRIVPDIGPQLIFYIVYIGPDWSLILVQLDF